MNPTSVPSERSSRRKAIRLALAATMVAAGVVTARVTAEAVNPQSCGGRTATIVGSSKSESLVGTSGADVIWAGAGRDRVYGLAGNDIICAGDGNDVVVGGAGEDWLDGGRGLDRVQGEAGWDLCKNGEQYRTCEILPTGGAAPAAPTPTAPPTTAPPTTAAPTTAPPTTAAPTTAPPTTAAPTRPGLAVNLAAIPPTQPGFTSQRIGPAGYGPDYADGVGAFRVSCSFARMAFDDPIVAPGQPNASHLHTYFGNTGVTASSTTQSIATSGGSTCTGGTANRTSYWVPSMIDTATGNPITSFHGFNSSWQHTGSLTGSEGMQVYYKTGYQGVPSASVQNFPAGLRMIAGRATRTSATGSSNPIVSYDCIAPTNTGGHLGGETIPACAPGNLLTMTVRFPQCWDGRNLDSADHQSHMAYGLGWPNLGCPASHPVPLPEVTYNVRYYVQPGMNTATWRLSSDTYSGPAGFSGHADWFNGWDANVFQRVVNNCYRPGLDCHMNLLGDGQALQ
jgi:hypothetical protein